jgi:phthiocerol/phenolphthiocerol synthesis type-I polyketide synthase E
LVCENSEAIDAVNTLQRKFKMEETKQPSFQILYDYISKRLGKRGSGDASVFMNYGYVGRGEADEASPLEHADDLLHSCSTRLVLEVIGSLDLSNSRMLDVSCGRGGTAVLLAQRFNADVTGMDLSPEAVSFCRRVHQLPNVRFEVGNAEQLPVETKTIDTIINIESSHAYPCLKAFFAEVHRTLKTGGWFLYADLLPAERWPETQSLLKATALSIVHNRPITANVLASCDIGATKRAALFGRRDKMLNEFFALPGSVAYENMRSGAWEYRIIRSRAQ